MKVLITGANGFLGKECVRLFKISKFNVITTDISGSMDFIGDLSDNNFVSNLPNDIDIVINCAAVQYVTKNIPWNRNDFFYKNNVVAAKNLSYKYNKIKFIHIGTSMMYSQIGLDSYNEMSKMTGEGIYSYSKMDAQYYINEVENSATIIPCIIGGEGREGLFRNFVNLIFKYNMVVFPGKGEHKINMVHVSDVAELILLVTLKNGKGFFNAAAEKPLSIVEWIQEISKIIDRKNIKLIRLPLRLMYFLSSLTGFRILAREQLLMLEKVHVLSIEKSKELGWNPKYTNSDIVRDITKYIIRTRNI